MKKITMVFAILMFVSFGLLGCSNNSEPVVVDEEVATTEENNTETDEPQVVNLFTDRHYDTDQVLYDTFTNETGIVVNVVKASGDELIERLSREGSDTEADLLITADAGRLHRAKTDGLLQAVTSDILTTNIPQNLKDDENYWHGLTLRARVFVYHPDRVNASDLSTYEALGDAKWENRLVVRSSTNIYNQSLLASLIAVEGEEKAESIAKGILNNMARTPQGNDRDQAKAVAAGEADLAIMNTYYIGKMLNSEDPAEVEVANMLKVFFPDQETGGTHVNISGIGMTKHAKNTDAALKLIEFLSGEYAQSQFAMANYEYPVHPNVEASELLKSWGEFKAQEINLSLLGEYNAKAVEIFNKIGWE